MRRVKTRNEELADSAADYIESALVDVTKNTGDSSVKFDSLKLERHYTDNGIKFVIDAYYEQEFEDD